MKQSEINKIIKAVALDEGHMLSEEIRSLGEKISIEDAIATITANIPLIAAETTIKILSKLGFIQVDPEDVD